MGVIPDIQKQKDTREIAINRVGIDDLDFPLYVGTKEGKEVLIYSKIGMYSSLSSTKKGTHMSRFVEILMDWRYKGIGILELKKLLQELKECLGGVEDVYVVIRFKYFLEKFAPATQKKSISAYNCSFIGSLRGQDDYKFILETVVPVTSVCPCSKAISEEGAHNQRGHITTQIQTKDNQLFWIEDLVRLLEKQGSCETYALLKRQDEKYVTEEAYKNPKFVEDIARDSALALEAIDIINWYKIKVENFESIHNHNAKCYVLGHREEDGWARTDKGIRQMEILL